MKILFLFILLSISIIGFSQVPGYTGVNQRLHEVHGGAFSEVLHIPAGTTPALSSGAWVRAGALYVDTTGGNKGFYYYIDGIWMKLADTTYTGFNKRFGVAGEDERATAARSFSFANNNFTLDSIRSWTNNLQNTGFANFIINQNSKARITVNNNQTLLNSPQAFGSVVSNLNLIDGFAYLLGTDSVAIVAGNPGTSYLKIFTNAADQFAPDRLSWRTTDSTSKIILTQNNNSSYAGESEITLNNPTGITIEPYKQNLYVDSLEHTLTATAKMVTWDSVGHRIETRAIPTGGGTITGAINGLSLADATTTQLQGDLTHDTRINGLNTYGLYLDSLERGYISLKPVSGAAGTFRVVEAANITQGFIFNPSDNDGMFRLNEPNLNETGFRYTGQDGGLVRDVTENTYSGTNVSAAVGQDYIITAWGRHNQIYAGTPYNVYAPNSLMVRSNGFVRIHADSAYISLSVGALGAPGVNEKMKVGSDYADIYIDSFRTVRTANVHQIADSAGWYFKIRNKATGTEADAYWPAGGGSTLTAGYGILLPATAIILDTTIAVNKAGAQVIAGIKDFTDGTGHMKFTTTTTTLGIYGPATSLTLMPKLSFLFNGDADAVQSAFAYNHDNTAWLFDAWYNGSNFVSSHASSNFAWYKTGNELIGAYNASTSKSSTFASFNTTGGLRLASSGNVGIGISGAGIAKFNVLSTAEQTRLLYDASNYAAFTVGSTGQLVVNETGTGSSTSFTDNVGIGTASITHALTINGQLKIFAPQAGDVDSIATWKDGILSATAVVITSGTYTPTATAITNLDGVTVSDAQYLRVGNIVTVSGKVTANPTAAGATSFRISLPVATDFGQTYHCGGVAFAKGIAGQGAEIYADTGNEEAKFEWIAVDITDQEMSFTFTYQIIVL